MADHPKRPYRMRQRAARQAETRRRIVEATVALHEQVGAARTTISAVAAAAGVERLTVYRHFPDEAALLRACSAHWQASNPPPDPAAWAAVGDPEERLARALSELYAYYGRTEPMLAGNLRDAQLVPMLAELMQGFDGYLHACRGVLMRGRPRRKRTAAAVGHALDFETWRSLVRRQGLRDADAVALMTRTVGAA